MPRKSRSTAVAAVDPIAAAIAAVPFAPEHDGASPAAFANLAGDVQAAIAAGIARDRILGLSGNDLRAKYGAGLTGPMRRRVLRTHGVDSGAIARSYEAYSDGQPRNGSSHARTHGPRAAERASEALRSQALARAGEASLADVRKALRAIGEKPQPVRAGDETALRAQFADAIVRDAFADAIVRAAKRS